MNSPRRTTGTFDMARARNIKPGMYKNEDLAKCSIWARYIFPGLWILADREGRLEDRPERIRAELLPYDRQNMESLLQELHDKGFINRYRNGEGKFIEIPKFRQHQNPHCKEQASTIPAPCAHHASPVQTPGAHGSCHADSLLPLTSSLIPDSLDSSDPASPASEQPVPPEPDPVVMEFPTNGVGAREWKLTAAKVAEYRESFPGVDIDGELRKARQWCVDNPTKRKTPNGMPAFLSRWLGKAQNRAPSAPHTRSPPTDTRDQQASQTLAKFREKMAQQRQT